MLVITVITSGLGLIRGCYLKLVRKGEIVVLVDVVLFIANSISGKSST